MLKTDGCMHDGSNAKRPGKRALAAECPVSSRSNAGGQCPRALVAPLLHLQRDPGSETGGNDRRRRQRHAVRHRGLHIPQWTGGQAVQAGSTNGTCKSTKNTQQAAAHSHTHVMSIGVARVFMRASHSRCTRGISKKLQ